MIPGLAYFSFYLFFPWRSSNVLPGIIVLTLVAAIVLVYYLVSQAKVAFDFIGDLKDAWGYSKSPLLFVMSIIKGLDIQFLRLLYLVVLFHTQFLQ